MNAITYIFMIMLAAGGAVPMSPEGRLAKLEQKVDALSKLEKLERKIKMPDQEVKEQVCVTHPGCMK